MPPLFRLRGSLALSLVLALTACGGSNAELDARKSFWEEALRTSVPSGSSVQEIAAWGASHGVHFEYLPKQRWLYANVERIPASGIPFPCSEWNIIVKIAMSEAGRSESIEVSTVGKCV
jgi:hypothetical protein